MNIYYKEEKYLKVSKMNFMNIGEKNVSIINEFLNEISAENEFEIRFGKYNFNPATKKSNFESNVEIDFFYRLKNYMESKNYKHKIINTNEFIFEINDEKIRKTIYENGDIDYISKNTKRIYNIYDFDMRLSLASEKKSRIANLIDSNANFVRIKKRNTYDLGFANIDFTIVKEGKTLSEANNSFDKFEVEFEIKQKNMQKLIDYLTEIMQTRQNNKFVISNPEKRDVFYKYKNLTGTSYFIGAQPETLQKDQLSLLYKELFSVTDKADGDRYFMMINDIGNIYYIDNNIQGMLKTNLYSKEYKNTLIDGELIISESQISFYAFDIMFVDGKDLRGNNDYLFNKRFDILKDVVKTIGEKQNQNLNFYKVEVKKFIYRNVFLGSEIIMDNISKKPYNNDGLIFTPMNEPYPVSKKWGKLLKWKPAEQNTIDFYSIKEKKEDGSGTDIWNLYVQGPNVQGQSSTVTDNRASKMKSSNLVLFDVNKLCGTQEDKEKVLITFQTTFSGDLVDPTTNEPYKSNTVIEYKWDNMLSKFIPMRTRWDKTANPKKHGNYYQVACSIWNNINNPITSETLFQMTNGSTPQNESRNGFFFERMNFFNSKVKEYLNNKYSTAEYLLTSKLFESKESYDKIIDNLDSEYIIATICDFDESYIDINYINENNQIMYYIKNLSKDKNDSRIFGKSFKIFINDGHRKHFDVSGECVLEYKLDYYTLIDSMKEVGYECIEADLYMNLYKNFEKMNKVKENNLLDYEKDLVFMYKYCVFKKNKECCDNKLPILKNQKLYTKKINFEDSSSSQLLGLQFYKIENIYNIIDVINCIEYKIYKNMFENKEMSDESILYWNKLNIYNSNLILHNQLQTHAKSKDVLNNIYIYNHEYLNDIHSTTSITDANTLKNDDHKIDDINQKNLSYSDYYIILYKNKIILNNDEIDIIRNLICNYESTLTESSLTESSLTENCESSENKQSKVVLNIEENSSSMLEMSIKKQLESSEKLTIPIIKEFLKKLALKTSGNKEELLARLNNYLNKNE